jgi:hypothetical protein
MLTWVTFCNEFASFDRWLRLFCFSGCWQLSTFCFTATIQTCCLRGIVRGSGDFTAFHWIILRNYQPAWWLISRRSYVSASLTISYCKASKILVNSKYTSAVFARTFKGLYISGTDPSILYPAVQSHQVRAYVPYASTDFTSVWAGSSPANYGIHGKCKTSWRNHEFQVRL